MSCCLGNGRSGVATLQLTPRESLCFPSWRDRTLSVFDDVMTFTDFGIENLMA